MLTILGNVRRIAAPDLKTPPGKVRRVKDGQGLRRFEIKGTAVVSEDVISTQSGRVVRPLPAEGDR